MEAVFLKLLNMSITASWLVLAIIVLRLLLKKAPKAIPVIMWAVVAIRLICPFSVESIWSLIPSSETVPANIMYAETPAIESGVPAVNSVVNPILSDSFSPNIEYSVNPMQVVLFLAVRIWIVGMIAMLLYAAVSHFLVYRNVREASLLRDTVWLCDRVRTPFVLGILRPRIYLPSDIGAADMDYVIAHEQAHLKRRDHWWKPLGFLLLTVYWFNPVLWIAYVLLGRDIELACDEKVIRSMGEASKKPYSDALVNCSVSRKMVTACPLAFGEIGVKGRIKSVLHYKKPAFWIIILAILLCTAVVVGFATNPISDQSVDAGLASAVDYAISKHYNVASKNNFACFDWEVLGIQRKGDRTIVYMWVLYEEYSYVGNSLKRNSGAHIPTAVTVRSIDGAYQIEEYWEPRNSPMYTGDIRDKFPWYLQRKALSPEKYIGKQQANCERMAKEHLLLLADPNPNPNPSPDPNPDATERPSVVYETTLSYADFSDSATLYTECLNARTMMSSSVRHYPIFMFESTADIERFQKRFEDELVFTHGRGGVPSFESVIVPYDSRFFEENRLLIVYVIAGSSSYRFAVNSVYNDGQNLCVHIEEIIPDGMCLADMAGWFITVAVPRSAIEHVTSFDADRIAV